MKEKQKKQVKKVIPVCEPYLNGEEKVFNSGDEIAI